ncbi:copper homeostasis protein CutC [Companilactobacillus crustorum]|uniref:PF03932 family protein CutC n=2 Tax=Companilactobacillus crustorum TaxID=392416 RepID=A0A837RIT9_9LACO|nr:CutC-like protein [Companilactobacillus crustorum]KRK43588.1 copper resistance protein [Companilactobacillus crustorum JCM 15951]KRO21030.1 copper resistance protein [Companilactobacillus crustorum]GEO77277.1 copper homeostasis protein CutC [Companilactobacillus crustorum]
MIIIYKEVAVENFTNIPKAVLKGANRIELNDNLAVGGTTPSLGVLTEATKYLQEKSIPVVEMIRPRGGNFVYNDLEIKMMETDLFEAQKLGVDGVAFGALTPDGSLDEDAMEQLIAASAGMQIVFHMAFDALAEDNKKDTIDWLIDHDVDRILTHGGPLTTPIDQTLDNIQKYIDYADGRIVILPGGGVNFKNADEIADKLGVKELHGTKIIDGINN